MNNVDVIEIRAHRKLKALEIVQIILGIVLIIVGILTFFIDDIMASLYIVLSMLLFIMAFNNYKIYEHKKKAVLYATFALVTTVSAVVEILRML